jgi:DNA-binding XRE family transcriptional regulator
VARVPYVPSAPAWVLAYRRALGVRLADARRAAQISQETLAHRIGVDRRTVRAVEAGQSDPRVGWLLVWARECGRPLADLLDPGGPPGDV